MLPGNSAVGAPEPVRELRLEGAILWFAAIVLAGLVVGAFWLGRWSATPEGAPAESAGASPPRPATPTEVPVEETLSFFDRAGGQGQVAEPRREADRPSAVAAPRTDAPPRSMPPGDWFVQVFAGRDRESAELVVRQLRDRGHPVRLDAERESDGSLYKVRVGGFPTREAADQAAASLRKEGSTGAWVTRLPR